MHSSCPNLRGLENVTSLLATVPRIPKQPRLLPFCIARKVNPDVYKTQRQGKVDSAIEAHSLNPTCVSLLRDSESYQMQNLAYLEAIHTVRNQTDK